MKKPELINKNKIHKNKIHDTDELKRMVQELQIYQMELIMQNEELKETQAQLEESRNRYADLYDLAPVGYMTLDKKGSIQKINLTGAKILGLEKTCLKDMPFSLYVDRAYVGEFYKYLKKCEKAKEQVIGEIKLAERNGSSIYLQLQTVTFNDRQVTLYQISMTDITELKAKEKLVYLASFPELTPYIIVEIDKSFHINYINQSAKNTLPDLEIKGINHPYLFDVKSVMKKIFTKKGKPLLREVKAGKFYYQQLIHYVPQLQSVRIYGYDITERKESEKKYILTNNVRKILNNQVSKSEALQKILDLIKEFTGVESLAILIREGKDYPCFVQNGFSEEFLKKEIYLCAGNATGDIKGMFGNILSGKTDTSPPFFTESGSFWTNNSEKFLAAEADRQGWIINTCNKEGFYSIALIPLYSGEEIAGILQLNDRRPDCFTPEMLKFIESLCITLGMALSQWQAQEELIKYQLHLEDMVDERTKELKKLLHEKEILLQEVYHRVKNNLQIISSLLHLQSRTVKDEAILKLLNESRNRIKSIAMVHENLYHSKDFSRINFSRYIRNFSSHLLNIYNVNSSHIVLNIESDNIFLNIKQAIPCGLIINELISNSLKYAFRPCEKGEIFVKFHSDRETLLLTVGDNGRGLPEDFSLENILTLGMELVVNLTKQLHGNIEIDRKNGALFRISFPFLS